MAKEHLSKIWPVLYFEGDWPSKSYSFDLGVHLIKAEKDLLDEITESSCDNNCFLSNIEGADNMRQATEWFLGMNRPEVNDHVPVQEIGISFADHYQRAVIRSFLMCLQLVRSTTAICPFEFPAQIQDGSIIDIDTGGDFYGIHSDKPPVYSPEEFEVGDLQLIAHLWEALVRLRRFDFWRELINKEEFFAALDQKAGENAVRQFVDIVMANPPYSEFSREERREHEEKLIASFQEAISKGEQFCKQFYRDSLEELFLEKEDEVFSNRTRIGRARNLYFEGLHLPLIHSFLSMCLVLETLFTVEGTEITYQFATRLANITGKTLEDRKDIFQRARNVYSERSNIVHGKKLIETVPPHILKDGFFLARQSLQHLLLKPDLLELYSDPITSDKTKDSGKAIKRIRDYFRNLDLR